MPVGNRHFHALLMKIAPSPKKITHSSMKIKPIETHSLPRKLAYSSMKITRKPHSQQKCNCCATLCNLLNEKLNTCAEVSFFQIKEMTWKLENKSFRWNYVELLEPPRVVHVRTTEMLSKENLYAQVTVRFMTKQVSDFITHIATAIY